MVVGGRGKVRGGGGGGCCCCLLAASSPSNMAVYLSDGSVQTNLRASTMR